MANGFFCPLRKKWVAALPEEQVRQALIEKMHRELGYPLSMMALEKGLDQLPHLQGTGPLPKRRADLIILAKGIHPQHTLYPLLLIECKAVPLNDKTLRQIIGYNRFVGAPFLALVNQTQSFFGQYQLDQQDFVFQPGFLPYEVLLVKMIQKQT